MKSINAKIQRGFTLIEVLVTIVLLGVLMVLVTNSVEVLSNITQSARVTAERENNRMLSNSLLQWSSQQAGNVYGQLPGPYSGTTGGKIFASAITDPFVTTGTPVSIRTTLNESGVSLDSFYDDGTVAENVRAYQRLDNQTSNIPLIGFNGETASITYDVGVVYSTRCARADTTCNTGIAGDSTTLTSATVTTWTTTGNDYGPYMVSTLSIQREGLSATMRKLDIIKERMRTSFNALLLSASAGDDTNWFYAPDALGAPDLSGSDAAVNADCYDGWYDLTDSTTNVLALYDLNQALYSVTQWGGPIYFCRDYSPSGSGEGVQPHAAALKINRSVTSAAIPTNVVADNIIVSF
jgi:prepilin-type N-terminal cleavage/methylation domain-containing protein